MNKHKDKNTFDNINIMELLKNLSLNKYDKCKDILENTLMDKHTSETLLSAGIFDNEEITFISPQKIHITSEILQKFSEIERNKTLLKFKDYLDNMDTIYYIEAGIFEYTVIYNIVNDVPEWGVTAIYESKLKDMLRLFDKNSTVYNKNLKDKIQKNVLLAQHLPLMTPQELNPDNWKTLIDKQKLIEYKKNNVATTDLYKCYKCGKRKCKVTMFQGRSADEGMGEVIVCMVCSNTWKL